MKLVCLMIARNEGWVLRASLRAALRWCDEVVFLDHCSEDDTPDILDDIRSEFPDRIHLLEEHDRTWHEMAHRQRTLEKARSIGATHCAIVDADEFLTANLIPVIRREIESLALGRVMQPPWICLWRSLDRYRRDESVWSRCQVSMAFADHPMLHWKAPNGYDHHHRHPFDSTYLIPWGDMARGGLMHLQHSSWERVKAKQAWYRLVEVERWNYSRAEIEKKYAPTTNEEGIKYAQVNPAWWDGNFRELIELYREPWQAKEVRKKIGLIGIDNLKGLDLQGIDSGTPGMDS